VDADLTGQLEVRPEFAVIRRAAAEALAGHATFDLTAAGVAAQAAESERVCPCTGCVISRTVYRSRVTPMRSPDDQASEIREALS
jgi:hypothetical protein